MSDINIETFIVTEEEGYVDGRTSIRGVVSSEEKAEQLIDKLLDEMIQEEAIEPEDREEARERFSTNRWVLDDMLKD
jgi:hypothetical protein